jgi:hypothetical protein
LTISSDAVVLMPLIEVNRGRIDGEVAEHRAQCLTWPVAEHLARDHEYLAAAEVIEKRRELEPVQARPEVTAVEQGHLRFSGREARDAKEYSPAGRRLS